MSTPPEPFVPLPHSPAQARAREVVARMSLDEKIALVGGDRGFFIRPMAHLGTPQVYMSDATQGIHIRESFNGTDLEKYQPARSTAFPCPLALAATWDPALAGAYAAAVGTECRASSIGILLGPGMNIYRHAQCGRNFEYLGEDPFLAARVVEAYVAGMQSTGTMATLKHFLANNTDWFRRRSNSIVDERAQHEIYMPAFEAGVAAGARAVMTSYNLLNGQWCGESAYVINDLLRSQLGFEWLVMSDWWAVYNGEPLGRSGQDLEMPHAVALTNPHALIAEGKLAIADLDRMCASILAACFSMRLEVPYDPSSIAVDFAAHEQVALQTAREGIVLLKNQDGILPIGKDAGTILLTGPYVEQIAMGGGSAKVKGFNNRTMLDTVTAQFGPRVDFVAEPTDAQLRSAGVVLCNVGTTDSEGWDRPFALPAEQEGLVRRCVALNPCTVVIVTSGSGVRMTDWSEGAAAILYAWYGGQIGNLALAEILAGDSNPSGKLPISIEKEFADSPGCGYLPAGEELYVGFRDEEEKARAVWDLPYKEGVFVGYRWYEQRKIEPLFPFGHGLSFTQFAYTDLAVTPATVAAGGSVTVTFTVTNTGTCAGAEVAQLYVQDVEASLPRPIKELKGFARITLEPGASERVSLVLTPRAFAFWNPTTHAWTAEPGAFVLHVGSSSQDIRLTGRITLG